MCKADAVDALPTNDAESHHPLLEGSGYLTPLGYPHRSPQWLAARSRRHDSRLRDGVLNRHRSHVDQVFEAIPRRIIPNSRLLEGPFLATQC